MPETLRALGKGSSIIIQIKTTMLRNTLSLKGCEGRGWAELGRSSCSWATRRGFCLCRSALSHPGRGCCPCQAQQTSPLGLVPGRGCRRRQALRGSIFFPIENFPQINREKLYCSLLLLSTWMSRDSAAPDLFQSARPIQFAFWIASVLHEDPSERPGASDAAGPPGLCISASPQGRLLSRRTAGFVPAPRPGVPSSPALSRPLPGVTTPCKVKVEAATCWGPRAASGDTERGCWAGRQAHHGLARWARISIGAGRSRTLGSQFSTSSTSPLRCVYI